MTSIIIVNVLQENHPISPNMNQTGIKILENKDIQRQDSNNVGVINESTSIIGKAYKLPLKILFLIQQINLLQRLRNDGITVSFMFDDSQCNVMGTLIVQTTRGSLANILNELLCLMSAIDRCGNSSGKIIQYFAKYDEVRNIVNQRFQQMNIDAGIAYINHSISVIAIDSVHYKKAVQILKEAFDCQSVNLDMKVLPFTQKTETFLLKVKQSMPKSKKLWLETEVDNQSSTCTMTATGPRILVDKAIQTINKIHQDYKMIIISIPDIIIFKTEYIRLFRVKDIAALENRYSCHIEIENVEDNQVFTPQIYKKITIECCQMYQDQVKSKIHQIIDDIIIEKEDSVSLYSKIGRVVRDSSNKEKLELWQKNNRCLMIMADHHGHRYLT